MKNVVIAIVAVAALTLAYLFFSSSQHAVADIQFTDIDGTDHQLSEYQGKPVLMIFWATDCPGCIAEMPELVKLNQEYGDNLQMIGVAMPHDKLNHIEAMRRDKAISYPLTWDKDGAIAQAFDNVRVTPTHFLISPKGDIVMRKIGEMKMEQLKQRLAGMGIEPVNS